ncbi:Hypothetical protein D9617_16g014780 [Elsinoe fawcettii]|nr:Hypothetical protein D9617_16g014780 [Elsinoe fawcettii]
MARPISPPPTKRRRLAPPATTSSDFDALRIFSWNINGITPFLPPSQKSIKAFFTPTSSHPAEPPQHSLRAFLRRQHWPHLLLLQEVHIAPSDQLTQAAVRRALNPPVPCPHSASEEADNGPHYSCHFTLPLDPHNATGFARKVHGVCTIARSDLLSSHNGTFSTVPWDQEGRFSILSFPPAGKWPGLSIWNVYAVNGTEYDWRDSETGEVKGTRHDKKLEVHRRLQEEVRRLESQGVKVVLAGDMNVARDERDGWPGLRTRPAQHVRNRRDFNERFFGAEDGGLGMVDTFREKNGERRGYSYYSRGVEWGRSCDRVDYVICSKGLRGSLKEAGILETEQERGPSDHVPVYAVFEFGGSDGTAIVENVDDDKTHDSDSRKRKN